MISWNNLIFNNRNSPIIEQLLYFHDYTMIFVIIITILIFHTILSIIFNKTTNRSILENQEIEIIWTTSPAIILILIAIPSLRLLYLIEENFIPSITIKIIGHQWYWSYEYPEFNKNFDSFIKFEEYFNKNNFRLLDVDNRVILPYNSNLRILIRSADVIHSWRIPSLGIKIDATPGRINQLNTVIQRPGLYYGQCSEICGANHRFMPISIEVTNLKNFSNWLNIL